MTSENYITHVALVLDASVPDMSVKVNPVDHPDYTIFVQSTSVNRKLVPGTRVLLLS